MKMMKTLAAFAFAIGIMFVGNMDAQASAGGAWSDASCAGCHDTQDNTPNAADTEDTLPPAISNTGNHDNTGTPATCASGSGCHGGLINSTHAGYANCMDCHTDSDLDGYSDIEEQNGFDAPANTAPEVGANDFTMDEDTTHEGTLTATDAEDDALTYALGTQATNGTATVNADGTFTYTPNADFNGSDLFTFTVSDGTNPAVTGTVNVTVTDVAEIDPTLDTDNDGLTDVEEDALGTDPTKADTDGDGIYDKYDANPLVADVVAPVDPAYGIDAPTTEEPPTGTEPPTPIDGEEPVDGEEPESTNPETGGTAGLMLSLGVTTVSAAGMVVLRRRK